MDVYSWLQAPVWNPLYPHKFTSLEDIRAGLDMGKGMALEPSKE